MQLRMTNQREIILQELLKSRQHLTADELYDIVKKIMPRISLATVYRNLEILSARGMIRKLELGGSQRRFEGDLGNHYHIRCMRCDMVQDAPIEATEAVEDALRKVSDFEIVGHHLEFIGICPACKAQEEHSRNRTGEEVRKES